MYVGLNALFMHEEFRLYDTGITMKSSGLFLEQKQPRIHLKHPGRSTSCYYGNVNHHLNTSHLPVKKDEELTFVANGNRSQAKEKEGEKIHSVHLREERKQRGGEVTGWGEDREGGYSSCINN